MVKEKGNEDNTIESLKVECKKLIGCLKDPLDFEILMYFIIYNELSLAQVEELVTYKSRTTAYRRIQNLLTAGLIEESREEKVRSNIPAKIYQIKSEKIVRIPNISQNELNEMTSKEKSELYEIIREAMYPTIDFMANMLKRMTQYLEILKPYPDSELVDVFNEQDLHLKLYFFTQKEYQQFIVGYQKFMQEFIPLYRKEEEENPNKQREFMYMLGLFPIKKMFQRILEEKKISDVE